MNHSPQINAEITVFDRDGKVKEKIINQDHFIKDYKIQFTVTNPDGSIVSQEEKPFRSFTQNFALYYNKALFGVDNITAIKTTAGIAPSATCVTPAVLAAIDTDTYGIFVGLNDNTSGALPAIPASSDPTAYTLRHKLPHGASGTNTMTYSATTADPYYLGDTSFSISRSFVNNSGAALTIGETAMVSKSNSADYVMICRDVKNFDFTAISTLVGIGQTLTIKYVFSLAQYGGIGLTVSSMFNENWLSMLYSDFTTSAQSFKTTINTIISVDMSAHPAYRSTLSSSSDPDFGIIIGGNVGGGQNLGSVNYGAPIIWGTIMDDNAVTDKTATIPLDIVTQPIFPSVPGTWYRKPTQTGSANSGNVDCVYIGATRSFKNISTGSISVSEASLVSVCTSSTTRLSQGAVGFTPLTLGVQETIQIKLTLVFPFDLETGISYVGH